jgi:Prokaryotic membrane lipoprotein lipid attachment site
MKKLLFPLLIVATLAGCSKSGGSKGTSGNTGNNGSGNNTGTTLFPLAQGNVWNYRLKTYNPTTGALLDSSNFSLTANGTATANGNTYYKLVSSLDNSSLWLANLSATTLGSIDSVGGISYYLLFATGSGDSTASASSWPVTVSNSCTGTAKLYGYYSDTTLINLDGTTYAGSIKNVVVIYDCSADKVLAQVYFVKPGVGLVRFVQYIYSSEGKLEMQLAWVLESSMLVS